MRPFVPATSVMYVNNRHNKSRNLDSDQVEKM